MKKMLSSWKAFTHRVVTADEARETFKGNPYKTELINELEKSGETITLYTVGEGHSEFTDLCRGGHSECPATDIDTDSFTLSSLAGAYWRGSEKNPMLTRIYGLAFETRPSQDWSRNETLHTLFTCGFWTSFAPAPWRNYSTRA
jgi:threonyl-tRNA synthetase